MHLNIICTYTYIYIKKAVYTLFNDFFLIAEQFPKMTV